MRKAFSQVMGVVAGSHWKPEGVGVAHRVEWRRPGESGAVSCSDGGNLG